MGFDHNRGLLNPMFKQDDAAKLESELTRQRSIEARRAEAEMAHELANLICPEDIKEFGRRHGISNFAEVVWNHGFMAGWRQRNRSEGEDS